MYIFFSLGIYSDIGEWSAVLTTCAFCLLSCCCSCLSVRIPSFCSPLHLFGSAIIPLCLCFDVATSTDSPLRLTLSIFAYLFRVLSVDLVCNGLSFFIAFLYFFIYCLFGVLVTGTLYNSGSGQAGTFRFHHQRSFQRTTHLRNDVEEKTVMGNGKMGNDKY